MDTTAMNNLSAQASLDNSVIPLAANKRANDANIAAIDLLVKAPKYEHILAWGKFLGFTPVAVGKCVAEAETDQAPEDSIQKIDGKWLRLDDIVNDSNRRRVAEIAKHSC
jgi:hypothetical protein